MVTATMFEAKTNLSELVKKALQGETVLITTGRAKKPVVELKVLEPKETKRLGAWYDPNFVLGDAFWEPMSDEECGYSDDGIL